MSVYDEDADEIHAHEMAHMHSMASGVSHAEQTQQTDRSDAPELLSGGLKGVSGGLRRHDAPQVHQVCAPI
jgi:hypothetical protein